MRFNSKNWVLQWRTIQVFVLLCSRGLALEEIRYSVLEESEEGIPVGNIAFDLGIDAVNLFNRKFRMAYRTSMQYFDINVKTGVVFIKHKIDREELCGSSFTCFIIMEAVMDNPLELFRIKIEIVDINDNSPLFPASENTMPIHESTLPGTHFPLENAFDPDVGKNSLRSYHLSLNDFFNLETHVGKEQSLSVELVLTKTLDREQQSVHQLILTALDGGDPERSGSTQITIIVCDANDNPPVFDNAMYKVQLSENIPVGSLVIKLNATDLDEGANADVLYSFSKLVPSNIKRLFSIDRNSGEIRTREILDFEETNTYEIRVQAKDGGQLEMTGHCKVLVDVADVNDNSPEIKITSFASPIREDAQPGYVLALVTVDDKDSGLNGQVFCEISPNLPFQIVQKFENYYSVSLKKHLDREVVQEYSITIRATDRGFPPLTSFKTLTVFVADVNDNSPAFSKSSYVVTIAENNVPGSAIFVLSAQDPDSPENAKIKYSLLETTVKEASASRFISVHSDTGHIFALQSLDYENVQMFQFQVEARDSGSPSLSSNTSIIVYVQDQNDNPPVILLPFPGHNSVATEFVPRSLKMGYIVTKIRATDADSGYNAWLSYEFLELANAEPFKIGQYTGEIRTTRVLQDINEDKQRLFILVKDHGKPSFSATVTLTISLVERNEEVKSDYRDMPRNENYLTELNVYLIISIASISSVFLFTVIVYTTLRNMKPSSFGKPELCPGIIVNYSSSQSQQINLFSSVESSNNAQKSRFSYPIWNNEKYDGVKTGDVLDIGTGISQVRS
ncbi:protocadherin alpha-8-like [Microcaecilia unicolor]|uniref:Protocadherin alpha-8-like n=1 Tax=Microcaecilia unicolor TaxID=1415580 RepID=A0A6P7YXK1_9AMPH|nr:protocadherin alpha-8-like [Microcaecilia unicolor]